VVKAPEGGQSAEGHKAALIIWVLGKAGKERRGKQREEPEIDILRLCPFSIFNHAIVQVLVLRRRK
jgi:hypothetical protein